MGFLSGLFGGGGSSSSASASTNVDVTVNPNINILNVVDLTPVEKLMQHLTQSENVRAAIQSETAKAQIAATVATSAAQIEATKTAQSQTEKLIGRLTSTTALAFGAVGVLFYLNRGKFA